MEYVHDLGKGRATGEPTLSHKEKFLQLLNALGYFLTRYERLLPMKRIKMSEIREVTSRLPADIVLQGEANDWRTILKDTQRYVCNYH